MMKEPSPPSISALVVNHNGGQEILKCLEALTQQTISLEEIVLVDNASSDKSPDKIRASFPQVKIIQLEENLGLSKARNIGLGEISSDFVIIIDDDIYLDSNCLHYLLQAQSEHFAAIVCPRILLYPEKKIVQCDGAAPHFIGTMILRHAFSPVVGLDNEAAEVQACIGACMFVDRRLLQLSGGFDENIYFYFEDLEFTLRMRSLGHKIVCEPKALVYHDRGSGTPELSFRGRGTYPTRRVFFNIRHRLMMILIHYKIRTLLVLSPVFLIYEIATLGLVISRGWFQIWYQALKSIYLERKKIMARRNFVQKNRKRRDRDLLSGGELPFAQGFLKGKMETAAVGILSWILNSYWKLVNHWIG